MSTTSTVGGWRAWLVGALEDARSGVTDGLQITRRWPGPDTEGEGIWLGDDRGESEIASIKAGRQHRNEVFELDVIEQSWIASTSPQDPDAAEDRLSEIHALLENVLATNPNGGGVSWSNRFTWETTVTPRTDGPGWRGRRTVTLSATSRLT